MHYIFLMPLTPRLAFQYFLYIHYYKFWVLQLSLATKIQLHVTHAIANLCSCIRQVAHDIELHATPCM